MRSAPAAPLASSARPAPALDAGRSLAPVAIGEGERTSEPEDEPTQLRALPRWKSLGLAPSAQGASAAPAVPEQSKRRIFATLASMPAAAPASARTAPAVRVEDRSAGEDDPDGTRPTYKPGDAPGDVSAAR